MSETANNVEFLKVLALLVGFILMVFFALSLIELPKSLKKMSEARLQYDIVIWFRNNYPAFRGLLMEMNNSTNKGATRAGMGLVKGASDLVMCSPSGEFMGFELKVEGSRHKVDHLESQLNWARRIILAGGCVFFVSDLNEFKKIIDLLDIHGYTIGLLDMARKSCDKIEVLINTAKSKNLKSVKINLTPWGNE